MSLNMRAIATALTQFVSQNVRGPNGKLVKCIVDRQNNLSPGIRPKQGRIIPEAYVTMQIIAPPSLEGSEDIQTPVLDENGDPTDDGLFNLCGQRRMTVSYTTYAEQRSKSFYDAMDMALRIQDLLRDPGKKGGVDSNGNKSPLDQQGLAVWEVQPVLDVTVPIESGYEPRAQVDAIFGVSVNRQSDLGLITKVTYSGEADEGTTQVEVPETTITKP